MKFRYKPLSFIIKDNISITKIQSFAFALIFLLSVNLAFFPSPPFPMVMAVDTWQCGSEPVGGASVLLTHCLEVECHHLTSSIPEELRHVVGRVHTCPFGIYPAKLHLVVSGPSR